MAPGTPARVACAHQRNGTANLFVVLDVHRGWRHVDVTEPRASCHFAHLMRALADEHDPNAERIRVVMDNRSTHSAAALYDTFEPAEARRRLRKLEIHDVPRHASWMNRVEIEIGVLQRQCLDRRIADRLSLTREIATRERVRDAAGARIRWMFTTERASEKLGRADRPLAKAREAAARAAA